MRFFTPILALSAAAFSIATTVVPITITALQFYVPEKPKYEDNISINIEIEAGNVADKCIADWKYGVDGQKDYPTEFLHCADGHFSFYFDSFEAVNKWSVVAKYTYKSGGKDRSVTGTASVTKDDLYCDEYLSSNRCELAQKHRVSGLPLTGPGSCPK